MMYMLHKGDFTETLAMCAGQADLVLTSPPYCDARTYGMDCKWTMDDYAVLGDAVFAALRPGGHAIVNVDAPVREWRKGFGSERGFHPWRMMLDWAERVGFRVPDRLAFGRHGVPGDFKNRFRNDWEPLLWFQKPGGHTFLDRRALTYPAKYGSRGKITARRKSGLKEVGTRRGWAAQNGLAYYGTLWSYGSVGNGQSGAPDIEAADHPARWPYRLASDIVRCFCPPDGLACDPFVGAGTSLVAAVENGRRFIGGDIGYRQSDGMAWVDVAEDILQKRARKE